jgi:cAMP phosphodiesterase
LGAYGAREKGKGTTALQLSDSVVIDAGHLLSPLGGQAAKIDHIFLTHCHMEHLADLPFLIDAFFAQRTRPLNIYGLAHTIEQIRRHIFNWGIWPDFSAINLLGTETPAIAFHVIEPEKSYTVEEFTLTTIPSNHLVPTIGYVIERADEDRAIYFSADTYCCDRIWQVVNENPKISAMVVECSFPSAMGQLAKSGRHLTPALLAEELLKLQRDDVRLYVNHLKPELAPSIIYELSDRDITSDLLVLDDDDTIEY